MELKRTFINLIKLFKDLYFNRDISQGKASQGKASQGKASQGKF